jgi:ribosome maturation factor RimP
MKKELQAAIERILVPLIERNGAFLVEINIRYEKRQTIIGVFIDTDKGISIKECAEISREAALELEKVNIIQDPYRLEVSSPGLDRPLKFLRQYPKNIGRTFRVQYLQDGLKKELSGELTTVVDTLLTFRTEKNIELSLPFETVLEAKEQLPW